MFNMDEVKNRAWEYMSRAGLRNYEIVLLDQLGYSSAPASKGHHLAVPGGLMVHSMNVADNLVRLMRGGVSGLTERSAYRIAMLHDLVKCYCYKARSEGASAYDYVQPPYPGHGVASVMICNDLGLRLTPEEASAITWHMGAFGLSDRELKEYNAAVKRFPEAVILTHAADHIASINEEKEEEAGNGR